MLFSILWCQSLLWLDIGIFRPKSFSWVAIIVGVDHLKLLLRRCLPSPVLFGLHDFRCFHQAIALQLTDTCTRYLQIDGLTVDRCIWFTVYLEYSLVGRFLPDSFWLLQTFLRLTVVWFLLLLLLLLFFIEIDVCVSSCCLQTGLVGSVWLCMHHCLEVVLWRGGSQYVLREGLTSALSWHLASRLPVSVKLTFLLGQWVYWYVLMRCAIDSHLGHLPTSSVNLGT